jgi:hypothetical protein
LTCTTTDTLRAPVYYTDIREYEVLPRLHAGELCKSNQYFTIVCIPFFKDISILWGKKPILSSHLDTNSRYIEDIIPSNIDNNNGNNDNKNIINNIKYSNNNIHKIDNKIDDNNNYIINIQNNNDYENNYIDNNYIINNEYTNKLVLSPTKDINEKSLNSSDESKTDFKINVIHFGLHNSNSNSTPKGAPMPTLRLPIGSAKIYANGF